MKTLNSTFSPRWFIHLLTLVLFCTAATLLPAQGIPGAFENIKDYLIPIIHVVFIIAIAIGLIRVVIAFISGDTRAFRSLVSLIIGVAVYAFFVYIVEYLLSEGSPLQNL